MTSQRRTAFTLIELLVVIGIVVLLLGILIPTVNRSLKKGRETRIAADFQTISVALDAYRADFGDFPRPQYAAGLSNSAQRPNPPTGAQILCRALIGPFVADETPNPAATVVPLQDGADGPGFRLRAQGKVWGPYIKDGSISLSEPLDGSVTFLDINGNPILYVVKTNSQSLANPAGGYIAVNRYTPATANVQPQYNYFDTRAQGGATDISLFAHEADATKFVGKPLARFTGMMGDLDHSGGIDAAGESAKATGPFILWSAGDDGLFGPIIKDTAASSPTTAEVANCDDVTNFSR
ncbi:MAG TPA: hypothetical protein VGN72_19280 [Tepidisphaeraceae bacterium]|jgi:type II secretory pathway pseudopilin PulG|nr:hypothetical protein [Tepidisphaeraceae bacterium]